MKAKKGFWKNFEFNKWVVNSVFVVVWLYIAQLISIFIFSEPKDEIGTFNNFLSTVLTGMLGGLVMTLLGTHFELRKRKKENH